MSNFKLTDRVAAVTKVFDTYGALKLMRAYKEAGEEFTDETATNVSKKMQAILAADGAEEAFSNYGIKLSSSQKNCIYNYYSIANKFCELVEAANLEANIFNELNEKGKGD